MEFLEYKINVEITYYFRKVRVAEKKTPLAMIINTFPSLKESENGPYIYRTTSLPLCPTVTAVLVHPPLLHNFTAT